MKATRGLRKRTATLAVLALAAVGLLSVAACSHVMGGGSAISGSGGGGSVANTLAVAVNSGPANNNANTLFASVTICVPGTTNCQSIPNVLVDTGSTGLRLLGSQVTLTLPASNDVSGNPLGECVQFADTSFVWGSVNTADIKLAGEVATSVPVQLISPSGFPTAPAACNTGGPQENTPALLGANGILGVGLFIQDCGNACATAPAPLNAYFSCIAQVCSPVTVALANQLQNPDSLFPQDNNGVLITLPSVGGSGVSATLTGSLIFGIGTQSNNALGSAKVYTTNAVGDFTTTYTGTAYSQSFIDSGSNAFFFLTSGLTALPGCVVSTSFYCPAASANFMVTNQGVNGTAGQVNFTIGNADTLFSSNAGSAVFGTLGGPFASPPSFDFGLPFFYGRPVFTAIETKTTPGGTGPFWAY